MERRHQRAAEAIGIADDAHADAIVRADDAIVTRGARGESRAGQARARDFQEIPARTLERGHNILPRIEFTILNLKLHFAES